MVDGSFFDAQKSQSKVKADIVSKYFYAWAKIIMPQARADKVAYVDLYCGPGKFEDGSDSTPILILQRAIQFEDMQNKVLTFFNDMDPEHVKKLEKTAMKLPGIKRLKHEPKFVEGEVEEKMTKLFEDKNLIPSLVFLDPWGYKGLTVRLISAMFKDWGCDTIFFFNYNRVNMNISNPKMYKNVNRLFGKKWADEVRQNVTTTKSPPQREKIILTKLREAIREKGGEYFLPFRFTKGKKTSHYLIFVSKHILGYTVMKTIMAGQCECDSEGVPSFRYDSQKENTSTQLGLFASIPSKSLEKLGIDLLQVYRGRTIKVKEIINQHHIGKRYIEKNYKSALRKLEEAGKIICTPPASKRRIMNGERTMADKVVVQFPN